MLLLKDEFEQKMKIVLVHFNYELLRLMFVLPYLKIGLLEKRTAHHQTASSWLKTLTEAQILKPQKIARTTYYVNHGMMNLLGSD
jgi:hypothetical protein